VVLWASFLTGEEMESEIPVKGQWEFKLPKERTFFNFFDTIATTDIPAYSLKLKNHKNEHRLMAGFFKDENSIEDFDEIVWKNHNENRKDFLELLDKMLTDSKTGSKVIMGYFDLADAIGHLSFGDADKMKKVYDELDDLAGEVKKLAENSGELILIVSDHGMTSVGRFGDHTKKGFYSFNKKIDEITTGQLEKEPNITDFFEFIKKMMEKRGE
jgi:predicted AlkP superfamily pyrophosphatase or phosphodiesterase